MAKNYFDRYVWLIDTIERHGNITFRRISDLWEQCSLNDRRGEPLSNRTFFNHIYAILETFGIEIKCDRSEGYYIANGSDMEEGGIKQWLLESISVNNLVREGADMRDRILLESVPSSQRWLKTLVNAMRDGKAVEMTYQSFSSTDPSTFTAHPYCVKLFKQRWYTLARSEKYTYPRIYSLDRIVNVEESEKALDLPEGFDAREFFANYYGIVTGEQCHAQTVRVKVYDTQVKYFESLPLHSSQTVEEETEEYTIFKYYLDPTYDFHQEILRHGSYVEVLEPEWFRQEIKEDVRQMMELYNN